MKVILLGLLILSFNWLHSQTDDPCKQILKGEVRDKISNELLIGAEVVLITKKNQKIASQIVNEEGKFMFEINCNTVFKLEGKNKEYTTESTIFSSTDENNKELELLILLGKGFIDFVVEEKPVETIKKEVQIDSLPKIKVEESIKPIERPIASEELPKEIIKDSVKNRYLIKVDNIYFDYESSYLTRIAKKELLKVVSLMKRYPKMILEVGAHTDAKGPKEYNKWLSDRRAKRTIDYIISRGINANRISGKGYGESELLNQCKDNVNCSEAEHAINRRTEFVIVKM